MNEVLYLLDASALAAVVRDSETLTAVLSALHAIGYTVVMGGAIVSGLRLTGVSFRDRPVREIVGPAGVAIAGGLLLSATTGMLLFAPRAVSAGHNPRFQLKMALLLAAAAFQFAMVRRVARADDALASPRMAGAIGLCLWVWLAVTACAFILLE